MRFKLAGLKIWPGRWPSINTSKGMTPRNLASIQDKSVNTRSSSGKSSTMLPVVFIWTMPKALTKTTSVAAKYTTLRRVCTARTNTPTTLNTQTRSRWLKWRSRGSGNHVNRAGINTMLTQNASMMLSDATTPNSMRMGLWVKMKVANPNAVVALVNSVAFPTLVTMRCSAIILLP